MKQTLYVGGYGSDSIARMCFEDGYLSKEENTPVVNASYLAYDAQKNTLYAVGETQRFRGLDGGSVMSFSLDEKGKLKQTSIRPTYGKDPCHLLIYEDLLLVSNYTSGSFTRIPICGDGTLGEPSVPVVHGVLNNTRKAHVHQMLCANNRLIAVADLGLDTVCFYDNATIKEEVPVCFTVPVPQQFGPRHMVFVQNSSIWYVLCELSGQLLTYRGLSDKAELIARSRIGSSQQESACAALRLSPDGKMLLATGREQGVVDLFAIGKNGVPIKLSSNKTEGLWPRDAVFTKDGKYVLCANERSNSITVFRVVNGTLEFVSKMPTAAPTCIVFSS